MLLSFNKACPSTKQSCKEGIEMLLSFNKACPSTKQSCKEGRTSAGRSRLLGGLGFTMFEEE